MDPVLVGMFRSTVLPMMAQLPDDELVEVRDFLVSEFDTLLADRQARAAIESNGAQSAD